MSKAKLPPVPPANQSPAGQSNPGGSPISKPAAQENIESRSRDPEQQGRQGNTWQNTHHQGHQQDR
ncbi:hypothetical protein [Falsiroseomonas selenitidurans]|uniref:Uncharacterized protein n=1 Tax=Falsiroseomonas selenitidurans TaxID=2716335 RepID=A0ABX1E444_9PROT|nr:hypothetical protein [Falsiroseomonas selenitidurans]NKC31969.1 hypothetical protein [Falsiroseomonas selenitidurans]